AQRSRSSELFQEVLPMPVAWGTSDEKVWKDAERAIPSNQWRRLEGVIDRWEEVQKDRHSLVVLLDERKQAINTLNNGTKSPSGAGHLARHSPHHPALSSGHTLSPESPGAMTPHDRLVDLAAETRESIRSSVNMLRRVDHASDLTTSQLATLTALEDGPLTMSELAEIKDVAQPTMSQHVSRLEGWGHVRRASTPEDGRIVRVELTQHGKE